MERKIPKKKKHSLTKLTAVPGAIMYSWAHYRMDLMCSCVFGCLVERHGPQNSFNKLETWKMCNVVREEQRKLKHLSNETNPRCVFGWAHLGHPGRLRVVVHAVCCSLAAHPDLFFCWNARRGEGDPLRLNMKQELGSKDGPISSPLTE